MQPENNISQNLETAKELALKIIDIVYEIKQIKGYVPTNTQMQKFIELQASLKRTCEDTSYITSCMERRMQGQHEHDYLADLAKKAFDL